MENQNIKRDEELIIYSPEIDEWVRYDPKTREVLEILEIFEKYETEQWIRYNRKTGEILEIFDPETEDWYRL